MSQCQCNVDTHRTSLTLLKVFSISPTTNRGRRLFEGAFVLGASVRGTCPAERLSYLHRSRYGVSLPARDDCALVTVMPCHISHLTAKREGSGANGVTINSEPSARSKVNTSKHVRHIASRRLAIMQDAV